MQDLTTVQSDPTSIILGYRTQYPLCREGVSCAIYLVSLFTAVPASLSIGGPYKVMAITSWHGQRWCSACSRVFIT